MQMTADDQEAVDSLVGLGKERSQNNESYTVDTYRAAKYGEGKKARGVTWGMFWKLMMNRKRFIYKAETEKQKKRKAVQQKKIQDSM